MTPPGREAPTAARREPPSGTDERTAAGLRTGLRLLVPFVRYGWARYLASALLALAGAGSQLVPYWAVYQAVEAVVDGTATRDGLVSQVVLAAAGVVAMTGLLGASTWMSHRAAFATLEQIRLRIGERLGEVPLGYLTRRRSGQVQQVLNDDVERLESFLAHAVPDLISAAGMLIITGVWLLVVDWRLGLAALSVILVSLPMMVFAASIGSDKTEAYGRAMARMNGSLVEFVRGMPVIRAFNRAELAFTETSTAIREATGFQAAWGRQVLPSYTAAYTLLASNVVVIVPVGLWLWNHRLIGTADLVFFLILGLGYTSSVMKLLQLTTQLGRLAVGAARVTDLDRAPVMPQPARPATLAEPGIVFEAVRFAHRGLDGRDVTALDDVSLSAGPGTVTALVGPSGSGKSTMAKLVCRFWDVDSGAVRVCGVDVREMPQGQLMSVVSLVLQETFLFDDTVAANLRLARPGASDDQVVSAAEAARAHEFIVALPQGYQTRIGERGATLSGGERQRLSIARAFLKDAPIVVLDEATAFVDPENETALQDALGELVRGRTLLIVAHRLSTIVGADQILVLDGGRIVERGTHRDLVVAAGLYTRMWAAFTAGVVPS
jgi:ATP-binding cassette, subfamily B, bacterial IrtA/YbtP